MAKTNEEVRDLPDRPIPFVRLNQSDNVCVAGAEVPAGTSLGNDGAMITTRHVIPLGHKFALTDIPSGASVIKYGEIIGVATRPIRAGAHVHLHNLQSLRDSEQAKERFT